MADSAGASGKKKKSRSRTVYEDASSAAGFGVDLSDSESGSKVTPPATGEKDADAKFLHRKEKKKKRKKSKDSPPASGSNKQPLGNPPPVIDLSDAVDSAVTKELAKQATVAPDIPAETMKLMKTLPSQAFIEFEAKTVFIDSRLKFKVLVNNLEAGTLLPDQITDIHALHPGQPAAAYTALKGLIMKTYTSVDAPEQARSSLLSVRMNAVIGPASLNNLLSSAKKTCDLFPGCDANNVTVLRCFANCLPAEVRQELFKNKIESDYASDVCSLADGDLSWLSAITTKAQLIWQNLRNSGALTGTAADLSNSRAGSASAVLNAISSNTGAAAAGQVTEATAKKLLLALNKGKSTGTKTDYFFKGDLDAQKKIFESKYDAETLKKRQELIASGKKIVNTDGPKGSCTNDYLFEKDFIVVADNRKKAKEGETREVRVCVKCGRLNHSASRCKESGAKKGKKDRR